MALINIINRVSQTVEITSVKDRDKVVWFLANPFVRYLEYDSKNLPHAIKNNVSGSNIRKYRDIEVEGPRPPPTKKLHLTSNFINEAGIYELISKSKSPRAVEFRDWVTRDILPALRKNGIYSMQQAPPMQQAQMGALRDLIGTSTPDAAGQVESLEHQHKDLAIKLAQKDAELARVQKDLELAQARRDAEQLRWRTISTLIEPRINLD